MHTTQTFSADSSTCTAPNASSAIHTHLVRYRRRRHHPTCSGTCVNHHSQTSHSTLEWHFTAGLTVALSMTRPGFIDDGKLSRETSYRTFQRKNATYDSEPRRFFLQAPQLHCLDMWTNYAPCCNQHESFHNMQTTKVLILRNLCYIAADPCSKSQSTQECRNGLLTQLFVA